MVHGDRGWWRRSLPTLLGACLTALVAAGGCGRSTDGGPAGGGGAEASDANSAGSPEPMSDAGHSDAGAGMSGHSDAGDGSGGSACKAHYLACQHGCIDPKSDPRHCGDCDTACAAGELCSDGHCSLTCLGGSTRCAARCVDVDRDSANCGACGKACAEGEVCSAGQCGLVCVGGSTRCADACVDIRIDPANCGGCEQVCAPGSLCVNGSCGAQCGAGKSVCDGVCVNTALDPKNCGACGIACPSGQLCAGGVCGSTCANSIACGSACVDPLADSANCGGCGKACATGQVCVNGSCGLHCELSNLSQCGSACSNLQTDPKNCGICSMNCGTGKTCSLGICVCSGGTTSCQGSCIDTKTDAANCGVCGAACGTNEACANGLCDCRPGTTRCGSACVDTSVNAGNCGACGAPCPAGSVCTYGECAAPSSDWPTFGYDVAHSGENLAESGKPPLSLAWSRKLSTSSLRQPALGAGRLFVTSDTYFGTGSPIQALNVSDGSALWSYNFGAVSSLGFPSFFSNTVYLANGKPVTGTAYLWAFDAAQGSTTWAAALSAQWEDYWAPIRVGSVVYTNAGTYGGLYGMNVSDGSQKFFQSLDQYDSWSAAYFSGHIYTFIAGHFRTHDASTGAVQSQLDLAWNWNGYTMNTAPVFNASRAFVIAPPNLVAIDPTQNAVAWTANGTYSGTPAVSGDSVYAISAGNLVVRDAATGSLKWTFVGDTKLSYPPVLANGYAYVASDANLYAVDMATHLQADQKPVGGWLIVGSHRLIVAGQDGTLTAYVLSK